MKVIIPINSEDYNQKLIKLFDKIYYKKLDVHLLLMGKNSDLERKNMPESINSIFNMNEEFNFSSGMIQAYPHFNHYIDDDELVVVNDLNYIFSYLQILPQLDKINFDKNFVSIDILNDTTDLGSINTDAFSLMKVVYARISSIEKIKIDVHDTICITKMKYLKQCIKNLEKKLNNFDIGSIFIELQKMKLKNVSSVKKGYYIGNSSNNINLQRVITPEQIVQKAISSGLISDLKPNLETSISQIADDEQKNILGVCIGFPTNAKNNPDKYLGPQQQWKKLITMLDKTKQIRVYILGDYPWNKEFMGKLNSTYYLKDEYSEENDDYKTKARQIIKSCKVTFGVLIANPYLVMSNEVGTTTLYYGWYIERLKNPNNTKSIGLRQVGQRFEVNEMYKAIRDLLRI